MTWLPAGMDQAIVRLIENVVVVCKVEMYLPSCHLCVTPESLVPRENSRSKRLCHLVLCWVVCKDIETNAMHAIQDSPLQSNYRHTHTQITRNIECKLCAITDIRTHTQPTHTHACPHTHTYLSLGGLFVFVQAATNLKYHTRWCVCVCS